MHLVIDSHSGSTQGPVPSSPEDLTSTFGYGHAGWSRKPRLSVPDLPEKERHYCLRLMENPSLYRTSNGNRNIRMQVDSLRSQQAEYESRPLAVFPRYALFSINLSGGNESEQSPSCEANANCPLAHEHGHPSSQTSQSDPNQACFQDQQPTAFPIE
jgi:hypothetical protein